MSVDVINFKPIDLPKINREDEIARKNCLCVALSAIMIIAAIFSAILAPWYIPLAFFALASVSVVFWNNFPVPSNPLS